METFIILFIVAAVFYVLGRYDKDSLLKFQREVITDALHREYMLIEKNNELRSEIVTLKAPQK